LSKIVAIVSIEPTEKMEVEYPSSILRAGAQRTERLRVL